jgi:hypothetical protein
MATKESFSSDEWNLLMNAPVLAGMGVSMIDFGVVSFAKEFAAMIRAVTEAKAKYPTNALVQALAAEFESNGDAPAPAEGKKTPDEILSELEKVAAVVNAKAPQAEAREFKTFLYGISETVANASGEGFLGFGEKVSDKEREYLARVKAVLAV